MTADGAGYRQVETWAVSLASPGGRAEFGIEGGTGYYGSGITSHLRRAGYRVIEVMRPVRQSRYVKGKTDTLDAESAALQTLSGAARAVPKTGDGPLEMIRQLKVARDTAVGARTTAMITLKRIIVNAPAELRETLETLNDKDLLTTCRRMHHQQMTTPVDAARYVLSGLADRHATLNREAHLDDLMLAGLVKKTAPDLLNLFGVGVDCAAELLIVADDNPDRINSEAAFAKLCGTCPIPASSGEGVHPTLRTADGGRHAHGGNLKI